MIPFNCWSQPINLFLVGLEIILKDLDRLFVDIMVRMGLQALDLVQTTTLIHNKSKLILGPVYGLTLGLAHSQDIFKAFECHLDDSSLLYIQLVAERRYGVLPHQVDNLSAGATRSGIGHCPSSFLADIKLCRGQKMNQLGNDTSINDGLDLLAITSRNVTNGPARLLSDALLDRVQPFGKGQEHTSVNDSLGLQIVTRDNISNGSQHWGLDGGRWSV
mmetsp:Transcript_11436/g.19599  ORF Transcript_11436/g.19599 Transcript_11436/m.19599 type:complete len:218 (-) Transcript_11436:658-1311(-)